MLALGITAIALICLFVIDRFMPKWVGTLPMIAFLGYMIYLMFKFGQGQMIFMIVITVGGESMIAAFWYYEIEQRKKAARKRAEAASQQQNES